MLLGNTYLLIFVIDLYYLWMTKNQWQIIPYIYSQFWSNEQSTWSAFVVLRNRRGRTWESIFGWKTTKIFRWNFLLFLHFSVSRSGYSQFLSTSPPFFSLSLLFVSLSLSIYLPFFSRSVFSLHLMSRKPLSRLLRQHLKQKSLKISWLLINSMFK